MNEPGASAAELQHVIDREVDLVTSAINLVASGGAPSTIVVGLRLTDSVIQIVGPLAAQRGVVIEPAVGVGRDDQRHPRPAGAGMTDAHHLLLIEDDEALAGSARVAPAGARLRRDRRSIGRGRARSLFAERARPSLILLDINLPGDTGWSVLRSDAYAAAGRPPVIVASAMAVSPARLREFGVAGYLPKPFALDTLRSTLDRVLAIGDRPTMTDLQIALILIACIGVFCGLPAAVRAGRTMNVLEIVAGVAAAFVFVYLLWALLRPEDF